MSRGPDASARLRRALERSVPAAGCSVAVAELSVTRWASATFVGARHWLTLVARDDAALAGWLAELAEADLPIRGHVVAEMVVASVARDAGKATVSLEALTVEV